MDGIKVDCWLDGSDIHVKTSIVFQERTDEMVHDVCQTKERFIREKLIALGWTPPKEEVK